MSLLRRRQPARGWRALLAAVLVVCLGTIAPAALPGALRSTAGALAQRVSNAKGAVVWEVDESTKEIIVTVRFAFSLVSTKITEPGEIDTAIGNLLCGTGDKRLPNCKYGNATKEIIPVARPANQGAIDRAIRRVESSIKAGWDDRSFGCYRLRVNLQSRFVRDRAAVRADEIHVMLDDAVAPKPNHRIIFLVEGYVSTEGERDYLSDRPESRGDPITGPAGASKWPLAAAADIYQHEFGHVIGLDDNYVQGNEAVRPGAVKDLMFDQRNYGLSWQSVARAIRRSGLDLDQLGCAWRYFLPTSLIAPWTPATTLGMSIVLCKVPLPTADPRVRLPKRFEKFSGNLAGSVNLGKLSGGVRRGAGPISGEYYVIDRGSGTWDFNIFLDPALSVRQRARVGNRAQSQSDELLALGSPVFPEAGIFGTIIGPEPWFLPLYDNPPECR